jgi:hypothetical protein
MKKILSLTILLLISLNIGCNDDSGGTVTDPFGGGSNTGTGNVTFTISAMQGQQGIVFIATPNASVKLTKVTVSLPAQQFTDVLTDDGTTVFNANEPVQLEEYTGVSSGQQWTFKFEGSLANGGQAFNVTSNYTIP